MITASVKTNLILKELGITRFSSRSAIKKSSINPIYVYRIQNVTVLLNKLFEEYENVQKKLIVAIMSSTTLTNGEFSGQSSSIDEVKILATLFDMNFNLFIFYAI